MWSLAITPEQFDFIYAGTTIMKDKWLFMTKPIDDEDMFRNYFPSKLWRLNSGLYKIVDKDGKLVPMVMRYAQHIAYSKYVKFKRIFIYKSRQQGISTMFLISFFDDTITLPNLNSGLLAHGLNEAKELKEKIVTAWDSLPDAIKARFELTKDVKNADKFKLSNGSSIRVAMSFRSGTLHRLHISEIAKISKDNPARLKEIVTGTMQAIALGLPIIVESTAEDTPYYREEWKNAKLEPRGVQFAAVFLSWVDDPTCTSDYPYTEDEECETYFRLLSKEYSKYFNKPLELAENQKSWYYAKFVDEFKRNKSYMEQEYPGYPDEGFGTTSEGTFYAADYKRYIQDKQVERGLYDPTLPVFAGSDLGYNDMMCFVFFQMYLNQFRIIGEYHNNEKSIGHYIEYIKKELPFKVDIVYLPHDGGYRNVHSGVTTFDLFTQGGIPAYVVPKTSAVINDIRIVRNIMPNIWIDDDLEYIKDTFLNYRKKWDNSLGKYSDKPKHDEWSNPADAIRTGVIGVYGQYEASSKMHAGEVIPMVDYKRDVVDVEYLEVVDGMEL